MTTLITASSLLPKYGQFNLSYYNDIIQKCNMMGEVVIWGGPLHVEALRILQEYDRLYWDPFLSYADRILQSCPLIWELIPKG